MSSKNDVAPRLIATGGMMLATTMNSLDSTIANVALPHIQGSLSASQDQITWVLTSYIVATAIMTPLSGWLSLKIGRKPLFLISIVGFVAASILCGIATNLPEMVAFRLLQGFAGAAMMPISQAAVLDLWPQRLMPRVMALWSAVIMVGPILGPTLGGFLTENFSWRWVFYINVPFGILAFVMVYVALEPDSGGRERPFDFLGFGALVLATGAIQLLADRGPGQDWFYSSEIWLYAILAGCSVYVFVIQTLTSDHPFFHRDLYADRNFITTSAFSFLMSAMLFGTSALLPTFMQNLLGYSAYQSGVTSMYRGFGSICVFAVTPLLMRKVGPRLTMGMGVAVAFLSLWQMAHFDLMMTAKPIELAGFIQGMGMGMMFGPLSVLGFATLNPAHRTEAAVLGNVVRTMGSSLGIALLQASLIAQTATAHERLAAGIVPSDPVIRWSLPHAFDGGGGGLEGLNAEVSRQGAMIGYDTVFAWMALISLVMVPLILIPRPARSAPAEALEVHPD
ncbi:DHA2 family efflux MFS transporter permease subunit [Phenylobacterium sp. LjRoot225]|uniref:DHA2 family efflux MFS transporter permease subunit n=1 Tax=Phenylobacterium sp. LjRoot225 TaxID=3342285 RepID=UPI003ECFAA08